MLESLKATLTWPGMTISVRSWVRNCKQCAWNKDRGPRCGKLPIFDGPFRVHGVRSDGILVINKGHYHEKIYMRRAKPFQSATMGEDVVPDDTMRDGE
ncbi:hypothetical protein PHMEG_00022109 [Phytophthora megakarya]|uniref:Integrase zinc-binding domain-containing protein n=1 Tax=Phytophthora megakarya TaxID=4795 RepID=A0A225VK12_9STRA|nr:hypothetical protein PHMEG_00022109 [Phytophthora megakarya]